MFYTNKHSSLNGNKIFLFILLSGVLLISNGCPSTEKNNLSKDYRYGIIELKTAGQRAVGDVDGDGLDDLFVAVDFESGNSPALYWYQYPSWIRYTISANINFRGDDFESGDIDGDGDRDIVVSIDETGKVGWFENPRPLQDPKQLDEWTFHPIGENGEYIKDVEVGDLNNDGMLDVVVRGQQSLSIFLHVADSHWDVKKIAIRRREGMALGDLDADGDLDVVLNGFWYETPENIVDGEWREHIIDKRWYSQSDGDWQDNSSNVLVYDLNMDGRPDVILCQSEKKGWPLIWYENLSLDKWQGHVIEKSINYCETLQMGDMDGDGDIDLVIGEMRKARGYGDIKVLLNGGAGSLWQEQDIARNLGIYDGLVADIGNDGDLDIIGCRGYNLKPIEWWESLLADKKKWKYVVVDNSRPDNQMGKMGLSFYDLNGDSFLDIIGGSYLYLNPGTVKKGQWPRYEISHDMDVLISSNLFPETRVDLFGIKDNELYWLYPAEDGVEKWQSVAVAALPSSGHYTQGYILAQIIPGGYPEIVLTRGKSLFYIEIPTSPVAGKWLLHIVSAQSEEEGVAATDIDGDGDLDLLSQSSDGRNVLWFEHPENLDGSEWTAHVIGESSRWLDRLELADFNKDGRQDVIVTEETQDWLYNANLYWFKAPADPFTGVWQRSIVATLRSINSLGIADMDRDGDMDIVAAEHTDQHDANGAPDNLTLVYENIRDGQIWRAHVVDRGPRSSHLGCKLADLDNNGKLDIVSLAWRQYSHLHLWYQL